MRVRWVRLKKICERIAGTDVVLIATTALSPELIAGTRKTDEGAIIVLNMAHVKTLDKVFEALAHELAHIVLGTEDHPQGFEKVKEGLRVRIEKEYGE